MSKPVKNMITESYRKRFEEVSGAVVIDIRGIKSNDNNKLRSDLSQQNIRISVVKNSLARVAFRDTALANLSELLEGPCALVYGEDSVVGVARKLVDMVKETPNLTFRGAIMDGQVFTADEIEKLSKFPTREEAQAQVIQLLLSPARNLVGTVLGPGRKVLSLIKAVEEKLVKGEAIAKVA